MANRVTAPGRRTLQTTAAIGNIIKAHYAQAQEDKASGRPIVWTFGLMPGEIWTALDVPVLTLEHVSVMLAAKQVIGRYLDAAEQAGFARDLCPYHTAKLGALQMETIDPDQAGYFVPPDLIVATNTPCMAESKSFLHVAEKYKVPCYFLDAPVNLGGLNPPERAIEYYAGGLRGLFSFLEQHGLKMDMARLSDTLRRSREMARLWGEVEQLRMQRPTPMGVVDAISWWYVLAYKGGIEEGPALVARLLSEVQERAARKIGVVPEEKYRLLYLGVPPFYNLGLFNYLEKYGAVFVKLEAEFLMTGQTDPEVLDPERPIESLARKAIIDIANPTFGNRLDVARRTVKDFQIDGIVAANKRGCRNLPAGFRLLKDMAMNELGVPMTTFDLDGLDLREYNDVQVKSNLDSFIETISAR